MKKLIILSLLTINAFSLIQTHEMGYKQLQADSTIEYEIIDTAGEIEEIIEEINSENSEDFVAKLAFIRTIKV